MTSQLIIITSQPKILTPYFRSVRSFCLILVALYMYLFSPRSALLLLHFAHQHDVCQKHRYFQQLKPTEKYFKICSTLEALSWGLIQPHLKLYSCFSIDFSRIRTVSLLLKANMVKIDLHVEFSPPTLEIPQCNSALRHISVGPFSLTTYSLATHWKPLIVHHLIYFKCHPINLKCKPGCFKEQNITTVK